MKISEFQSSLCLHSHHYRRLSTQGRILLEVYARNKTLNWHQERQSRNDFPQLKWLLKSEDFITFWKCKQNVVHRYCLGKQVLLNGNAFCDCGQPFNLVAKRGQKRHAKTICACVICTLVALIVGLIISKSHNILIDRHAGNLINIKATYLRILWPFFTMLLLTVMALIVRQLFLNSQGKLIGVYAKPSNGKVSQKILHEVR